MTKTTESALTDGCGVRSRSCVQCSDAFCGRDRATRAKKGWRSCVLKELGRRSSSTAIWLHIFKKMGPVGRSESTMCRAGQRGCNPRVLGAVLEATIVIKTRWF